MRNLKLTLEYDGSPFSGFQRQPKRPSIQEALEAALSKFFNQRMKIAAASGRTDAGAHARGQVVNFKTHHRAALWQIQKGLNAYLPPSIAVKKIEEVSKSFHARFSAHSKTYEYCVWNDPVRSPFWETRALHIGYPLNLAKMRKHAKLFLGQRDFRAFCTSDRKRPEQNTVRTIKKFILLKQGPLLRFQITADGFLYHMVRNMVGTVLEAGRGKLKLEEVRKILQSKDRQQAGATVPAKGLTLLDVTY